jgi:hypothetical protein
VELDMGATSGLGIFKKRSFDVVKYHAISIIELTVDRLIFVDNSLYKRANSLSKLYEPNHCLCGSSTLPGLQDFSQEIITRLVDATSRLDN